MNLLRELWNTKDPKKIEEIKRMLMNALIGLVIFVFGLVIAVKVIGKLI